MKNRISLFNPDTGFYARFRNGSYVHQNRRVKEERDKKEEEDEDLENLDLNPALAMSPWRDKIVVYTTTLGFVRKTKADCVLVKKILRCLMLKSEERDLLDRQFRHEFVNLFPGRAPPQVVICNQHIGECVFIRKRFIRN